MATKKRLSFDKDQTYALASGVTGIINVMNSTWDDVDKMFRQCESEEIISASDTKKALLASIKEVREGYKAVTDKLDRMKKAIEAVCETTGIHINKNISNTEEATQVIAAAKKKAEEATGANA